MIDNCLGLINIESQDENFNGIAKRRPAYMLPFGGRYRLVDFILSNMVNYGIKSIGLYTGDKPRSPMEHIGDGSPWELNRRVSGMHIFPKQKMDEKYVEGDLVQYYLTDSHFKKSKEENIYLVTQNKLVNIDLDVAYQKFVETDADVLLIYSQVKNHDKYLHSDTLVLDENQNFKTISKNFHLNKEVNLFLGNLFIKKTIFRQLVLEGLEEGTYSNLKETFLKQNKHLKIETYKHEGYFEDIKNIANYYLASMNLLDEDIKQKLFYEKHKVFTRTKDEPPSIYTETSNVRNSLIANGCVIEGEVSNSIIFRGVKIEKGAKVTDSIVMQKSHIKKNAHVSQAVLDKHVVVNEDVIIVGTKSNPHTIEKKQIIRKAR